MGGGISDLAMVPAGVSFYEGVMVMCCWSNTDNGTGLGLRPLRLSASVTQNAQNSQNKLRGNKLVT